MTDRKSASAGSAWDAEVLPTDDVDLADGTNVTARVDTFVVDADGDPDADPEVRAIVEEIEVTRSEMAGTVGELGERLDPGNIADRARERVREATIGTIEGKVDEMTTAASELASDAGRTAQEAGSGLMETIRQNPVPAALAGIGIGWLVLNRRSATRRWPNEWDRGGMRWAGPYAPYRSEERSAKDDLARRAGEIPDAIGRRADDAREAIGDAAYSARRAAGDAVSSVGMTAGEATDAFGRTATDVVTQAQQAVEANPIAFGAIAVAVGAAVGLALPASDAEKRVMGSAGSQLIDKVENAVSEPLERMETSANR